MEKGDGQMRENDPYSLYNFRTPRRAFWSWGVGGPTIVHRKGIFKQLRRFNGEKVRLSFNRRREWLRRWRTPHPSMEKFPVFVVSSNRSGTQMVCEAIGKSPHGWDCQENEATIAFKDFQLRADWLIK